MSGTPEPTDVELTGRPIRAFILGAPTPLAAGLAHAWLRAGNKISAIYCAKRGSNPGRLRKDERLGRYCPPISLSAIASRCGIELKFIGTPDQWDMLESDIRSHEPDVILSLMFMARIPSRIIAAARGRLLNLHPALLPAYRGLSSLSSMQYDGTAAEYAGLTLHIVTEDFDTGPIVAQVAVPPPQSGTFANHLHALITEGGRLIAQTLPAYLAGILKAIPQRDPPACRISHAESAMVVRSSHRIDDIKRILTSIGPLHKLAVEGLPPHLKVDRFIRRLGSAKSQPPRLHWHSIDLDLADGRVRLRWASPLRDRLRKMAMTRKLVRLQLTE